jgi:hypothetical protein
MCCNQPVVPNRIAHEASFYPHCTPQKVLSYTLPLLASFTPGLREGYLNTIQRPGHRCAHETSRSGGRAGRVRESANAPYTGAFVFSLAIQCLGRDQILFCITRHRFFASPLTTIVPLTSSYRNVVHSPAPPEPQPDWETIGEI